MQQGDYHNLPSPTLSICKDTLVGECVSYPSPTRSVCENTLVGVLVSYPSPTRSICKDTLVIPSMCIRRRDIVITSLVRVSVCLVSQLNS